MELQADVKLHVSLTKSSHALNALLPIDRQQVGGAMPASTLRGAL
jgi:hypothetical protein